jgi:hypothetical protein
LQHFLLNKKDAWVFSGVFFISWYGNCQFSKSDSKVYDKRTGYDFDYTKFLSITRHKRSKWVMKKFSSVFFIFAMLFSVAFIAETTTVSAQQTTVKRKSRPGLIRSTYRGGRWVVRRTWDGTKWVSKRVWVGTKYGARKTAQGTKYVGRKTVKGAKAVGRGTKKVGKTVKRVVW